MLSRHTQIVTMWGDMIISLTVVITSLYSCVQNRVYIKYIYIYINNFKMLLFYLKKWSVSGVQILGSISKRNWWNILLLFVLPAAWSVDMMLWTRVHTLAHWRNWRTDAAKWNKVIRGGHVIYLMRPWTLCCFHMREI